MQSKSNESYLEGDGLRCVEITITHAVVDENDDFD